MTLRSQTAALAVLFVALTVIFLLVGDAGVSTGVFLPEPTLTYTPTVAPTATPGPDPGAANWTEATPGQWTYTGASGVAARINYDTVKLDEFITGTGLTAPAADAPYPLLAVLSQLSESLQTQATDAGLTLEPGVFSGPIIEIVGETPVALMHARVQPQTRQDGQQFLGLDLVQALIDQGEGDVTFLQYVLQGAPDDVVYGDFRAWLEANVATLYEKPAEEEGAEATPTEGEATPAPEEPAGDETGPGEQPTPAPEQPQATPEAQPTAAEEESGD
ncbi:MAG: hypothetical protein AB1435_13885 [Chloroflexota bacterium]|jgi:hypothetical protein